MLLGIHLTLLIGPTVAVPAPPMILEAINSVQVNHNDTGRSGFQMTFQIGRSGPKDVLDYNLLSNPLLKPFNRVILIVVFSAIPRVLMDGIITNQQLSPGAEPGSSTLTITGEDVSVMMDMEEKIVEHPAQSEIIIATKIITDYAKYGLIPQVIPPPSPDMPIPVERVPVQHGTDLEYIQNLAERCGYVFYIIPGPVPGTNRAYWGPPVRAGIPQRALSTNMGPDTNLESISFQNNALAPTLVYGKLQDRRTNKSIPVKSFFSTRIPLTSQPSIAVNFPNVRKTLRMDTEQSDPIQAFARAQAETDKSNDEVVSATGELDALRYGDILQPRSLVGLRGSGYSYDGVYYVKSVSHSIKKEEYKQNFTLTREGLGAISPVVIP